MTISEAKLRVVSEAMDRLSQWALNTLTRLKRESSTLLMWLRSAHSDSPYPQPFHLPQEPTTVKRYVSHWKHLFFYVLRTSTLDRDTRDRLYGIQFTDDQLTIIGQLLELLDECDEHRNERRFDGEHDDDRDDLDEEEGEEDDEDGDFHSYDPDEDDGEYESTDEHGLEEETADDHTIDMNEEYSSLLTRVAEKLMELSIAFITQRFPTADDLRSPLTHFTDVMAISNRSHQFLEPYNYTSYVAGLIWMCRLLIMEYALPSREYATIGWRSHEAYQDKCERLKPIHDDFLTEGTFGPVTRLIRLLCQGKETVRAVGRPGLLLWDLDYQGVKLKEIYLRLDAFKQFVVDGIKSTERILREELFFGMDLPEMDLNTLVDVMGKVDPFYSFMEGSADKLPDGCEFMFDLMKSADSSKQLIDAQGRWDMIKVNKYLKAKNKFQRKLMKGNAS